MVQLKAHFWPWEHLKFILYLRDTSWQSISPQQTLIDCSEDLLFQYLKKKEKRHKIIIQTVLEMLQYELPGSTPTYLYLLELSVHIVNQYLIEL